MRRPLDTLGATIQLAYIILSLWVMYHLIVD